jgi:hypothetical protein
MKNIFFIILFIPVAMEGATLKGKVTDPHTHTALRGATVIICNTKFGATAISSYFQIDSVPIGRYIVKTSYVGYYPKEDTITISASDEVQELNISLSDGSLSVSELRSQLLTPNEATEIDGYQDSLFVLARQTDLISITIDSLYLLCQKCKHKIAIDHLLGN